MENNSFDGIIADIDAAAKRTEKILAMNDAEGLVDLSFDVLALLNGEAKVTITNSVTEMTPAQAKQIGWAIFQLGRYGEELETAKEHKLTRSDIADDDFFRD